MRTIAIIFVVLYLLYCNTADVNAENNNATTTNNASIAIAGNMKMTNYAKKKISGLVDLPLAEDKQSKQIESVESLEKPKPESAINLILTTGSKVSNNTTNSSSEKILRRRITPTGDNKPETANSNKTLEKVNAETNNTNNTHDVQSVKLQQQIKTVAEGGVVLDNKLVTPANAVLKPNENSTIDAQNAKTNATNIVKATNDLNINSALNSTAATTTSAKINSTTTTTTSTTTTTTTTTTTAKPKKPRVLYGVEDIRDFDLNPPAKQQTQQKLSTTTTTKSAVPAPETAPIREAPHVQPSQEMNGGSYHSDREYFVPIMVMIFTIPLIIGIFITTYQRCRDRWSTRHYRRMDFLVDGMYND